MRKIKIERIKDKKKVIIGSLIFISIIITLILITSKAKYKNIESIDLASGTINYSPADIDVVAINIENDSEEYESVDTIPTSGYMLSDTSYCNVNGEKDTSIKLTYENGKIAVNDISKKIKCYLYFDKKVSAKDIILEKITLNEGVPDFTKTATTDEGVYKAKDESGNDSYYFRGAVTNNYVKFANKFWRIIRINGDGSVRLIYDDTKAVTNGTINNGSIVKSISFNPGYTDNMYVGFKYKSGEVHGLETKSTILTELENWYISNLSRYESYIDTNAGFCGDRTPSTNDTVINNLGGTGNIATYYGSYIRLVSNKIPSLICNNEDFYTISSASKGNKSLMYPIGLITADEVVMAGGKYGLGGNYSYYLYNGQGYWTISPFTVSVNSVADVFYVNADGRLDDPHAGGVNAASGLRPVINLQADTKFTGTGSESDPFVVV